LKFIHLDTDLENVAPECFEAPIAESQKDTSGKKKKSRKRKIDPQFNEIVESSLPLGDSTLDVPVLTPEDCTLMKAWSAVASSLHPWIIKGLLQNGFTTPRDIQAKCLPFAMEKNRNLVGVAHTGSGKTLAYGLPLLNDIVTAKEQSLIGLILAPTRELALQISEHLNRILAPWCSHQGNSKGHIVALVGGISPEKQKRLIAKSPCVIVATPGRLWDLTEEGVIQKDLLQNIRYFILDEADKMLEKGKFKELENVLKVISLPAVGQESAKYLMDGEEPLPSKKSPKTNCQMFVFSATLPTTGPAYSFNNKEITMKKLLSRLNMKNFHTVDVTGENKVVDSLVESKIDCLPDDKDIYLYYLLSRYPGRTLVFVNAISSIRRLAPIFSLLNLNVYALHAQMQQRQRFKNLERFAADQHGILIASDVASRGLDVKNIDHVIHYQVPLSSDLYVHRSGRTARAECAGLSIVLVSPPELQAYKKICLRLGKIGLKEFPVEMQYLNPFRKRFNLAKRIETVSHTTKKKSQNDSWMKKAADALEVEYNDDGYG
jgi:ATP-dependent RNA helicase DDX24/MAK5